MGWFRGQGRLGAWLALVALALQLGLSFGHIHAEAPDHAPGLAAATPADPQETDQASHHDHGDTADRDYCPCCAILSLLAGAQTGAMSPPAMPVWQTAEVLVPAAGTTRPASIRAAFRARAPPSA
jgi:hypothetical protein